MKRNWLLGPGLGLFGGTALTIVSAFMDKEFDLGNIATDIISGGVTGFLLGPFVLGDQALKLSTLIGLPLYGGVEGYITDGIKGGEWNTSLNFFDTNGVPHSSL